MVSGLPKGYTYQTWTLRCIMLALLNLDENNEFWNQVKNLGHFKTKQDTTIAVHGCISAVVKPDMSSPVEAEPPVAKDRKGKAKKTADENLLVEPSFGNKPLPATSRPEGDQGTPWPKTKKPADASVEPVSEPGSPWSPRQFFSQSMAMRSRSPAASEEGRATPAGPRPSSAQAGSQHKATPPASGKNTPVGSRSPAPSSHGYD
ncbi:hypothetical protein KCU81_g1793, partial [Aureobasidium melanogenum]